MFNIFLLFLFFSFLFFLGGLLSILLDLIHGADRKLDKLTYGLIN